MKVQPFSAVASANTPAKRRAHMAHRIAKAQSTRVAKIKGIEAHLNRTFLALNSGKTFASDRIASVDSALTRALTSLRKEIRASLREAAAGIQLGLKPEHVSRMGDQVQALYGLSAKAAILKAQIKASLVASEEPVELTDEEMAEIDGISPEDELTIATVASSDADVEDAADFVEAQENVAETNGQNDAPVVDPAPEAVSDIPSEEAATFTAADEDLEDLDEDLTDLELPADDIDGLLADEIVPELPEDEPVVTASRRSTAALRHKSALPRNATAAVSEEAALDQMVRSSFFSA